MSLTPMTFDVAVEAAAVMGATYAIVRFTYSMSRHMGASVSWKPSWWALMAFWVVVAAVFLGDVWANDHTHDCLAEFPAAKLMDRRNPDYSVVRNCEDENRAQKMGRMLAVTLVLGVACFTGVRKGQRSGEVTK